MKIALVSPYDYAHPGGVNSHISHLEDNFTLMGHEVKIIASSSRPLETRKKSNIILLGKPVPIRASGSVVRIPISPRLVFSDQVKAILRGEKFDVIHIHEPLLPALSTAVLHHSSQELVVGTFHAYRSHSWGYLFWKHIILNRWFNKLDGRIAVSRAAMGFISRYFPAEYTIIPNGIDFEHFSNKVAPVQQYCDGKLNILFVGRMEKRKGFKYLLRAYELAKKEFAQCRLIVVSPYGHVCRQYQRLVAERGLKDVVFAGYVTYEDLPCYYQAADIFCSPATGKESFGMVLLEAMAAGKPIIASEIAGYADLISHGVEGLLVRPEDERALANTLLYLLYDSPTRERLGVQGQLKAGHYGWEGVAQKVILYYQKLLEGHTGVASGEIACAC